MSTWGDVIATLFQKAMCYDERRQLAKLKVERDQQERRLEEITRATLDGETEWFLKVVKHNPACALKVVSQCHKEK